MPAPTLAEFPLIVQLVMIGPFDGTGGMPGNGSCPGPMQEIAPPLLAELPLNVQFVSVGLLLLLYIPPPLPVAELSLNVQLVRIGLLYSLYIPPPRSAELLLIMQFLITGPGGGVGGGPPGGT